MGNIFFPDKREGIKNSAFFVDGVLEDCNTLAATLC